VFKHVLIPTDGSEVSMSAIDPILAFARDAGARVTFVMVVEPFHLFSVSAEQLESSREGYAEHASAHAAAVLAKAAGKARSLGVEAQTLQIESDRPFEGILEAAATERCDLIAMASHGRGGLASVVIGSQTQKVLTHSKIPVLVYR
jgi:nucleotide-binding universal stress UspA family protein